MQNIEIAVFEAVVRSALPRATEDEVAAIVRLCEGRTLHPDNAELLTGASARAIGGTAASTVSGHSSAAS